MGCREFSHKEAKSPPAMVLLKLKAHHYHANFMPSKTCLFECGHHVETFSATLFPGSIRSPDINFVQEKSRCTATATKSFVASAVQKERNVVVSRLVIGWLLRALTRRQHLRPRASWSKSQSPSTSWHTSHESFETKSRIFCQFALHNRSL